MAMCAVPFDNLEVTNDSSQNIWEFAAPSDSVVKLHHFELYSATTSDERVRLRLVRLSGAGSVGAASTELALDGVSEASGGGVDVTQLNPTPGTVSATLLAWYWSQLSPLVYLPTPEARVVDLVSVGIGRHSRC